MKKSIKLMAIIIAVSTFVVTGCGKNNKKVVEHKTDNNIIENEDIGNATLKDTKSLTAEYTVPSSNEDEDDEKKKVLVVFKSYIENDKIFAIVTGYDEKEQKIWTYKTGSFPVAQNDNFDLLGTYEDRIFLKENNYLNILTAKNGKIIYRTADLEVAPAYLGFGRKHDKKNLDNYKDYFFIMGTDAMGIGCKKIFALDYETGKIVKTYDLPEAYSNYEYETKIVDGAPLDIYIEFTKYTTENTNKNKTGFFATDILDSNFKAKEIVIK